MRILVTGANGRLGGALLRCGGHEFIAAGRNESDIQNLTAARVFIAGHKPDAIINCAAYTDVDKCESDPDGAFALNALGARNLAVSAEEAGAKLIHVSTDYVFSGGGTTPYREWDLPGPQSVYGHTKLAGEGYVRQFCKRAFIVRTAWLYGLTGNNFVKTILNAAKQGDPVRVVDDQIGNPTNAADLARHLLKLAQTDEYGVYHCTNNGECSWFEFACAILKLSGIKHSITPCSTQEFPRPAKRPAYSSLDNMMLRLTVGDEMRHWKDALAEHMAHYDKRRGDFNI